MVGGERRTEVNGRRVNESVEHLMSSCPLMFSTGTGGFVIIIHYYNNADEAFVFVWGGEVDCVGVYLN